MGFDFSVGKAARIIRDSLKIQLTYFPEVVVRVILIQIKYYFHSTFITSLVQTLCNNDFAIIIYFKEYCLHICIFEHESAAFFECGPGRTYSKLYTCISIKTMTFRVYTCIFS